MTRMGLEPRSLMRLVPKTSAPDYSITTPLPVQLDKVIEGLCSI